MLLIAFFAARSAPKAQPALAQVVRMKYFAVANLAPQLHYSRKDIEDYRKLLETQKKEDIDGLEAEKKRLQTEDDGLHAELTTLNKSASYDDARAAARRSELHCRIWNVEMDLHDRKTERSISLPVDYDHRIAKLGIVEQWPAKKAEIAQAIADGKARQRRHGDVEDIGFRKLGEGQENDFKLGEDAVTELRDYHLLPPECDSRPLRRYVEDLANRIAGNSDLKIPLVVSVLDTGEVNAFGLPGGRLFVDVGLVAYAESEEELAGVMAHEIAHIAARHGAKLTKPTSSVSKMVMEGATLAANTFTGGAVGEAQHYAREYLGLGAAFNLSLLGVNADTEAEAGQLGMQYVWRAGIDPQGFLRFYDRMASDSDNMRTASFFRTHPPGAARALTSLAELEYLPKKTYRRNSTSFERAREMAQAWLREKDRDVHAVAGVEPPAGCHPGDEGK